MKTRLVSLLILIPCIIAAIWADGKNIKIQLSSDNSIESIKKGLEKSASWERAKNDRLIKSATENLTELATSQSLNHTLYNEAGRAKLILALGNADSAEKHSLLCESRYYFKKASELNPRNPIYQISIADIESLSPLLQKSCDQKLKHTSSNTTPDERLDWALKISPNNLNVIYKTALIHRLLDKREQSLKLFRKYQELVKMPSWQMRSFLVTIPRNSEELLTILPRRYPEIISWADKYKSNYPNLYEENFSVFEKVLNEIIDKNLTKVTDQKQDEEQFIEIITDLSSKPIIAESDKLHKRVYSLLFEYYSKNNDNFAADISKKYASLNRATILKSSDFSRKSPKSGSIYNWEDTHNRENKTLDLKADNLGFYSPEHGSITFIAIKGSAGQLIPENTKVKIWTSSDNLEFSPYQGEFEVKSGQIEDVPILGIELPTPPEKYTKIYFQAGSTLGGKISNTNQTIIEVFKK